MNINIMIPNYGDKKKKKQKIHRLYSINTHTRIHKF